MSEKIDVKTNNGIINTGTSSYNTIISSASKETTDIFSKQAIKAINRINAIKELTDEQKEYLVSIVNEAKTAEDEVTKQSCKNSFKSFMKGLGKTSERILSVFADLIAVATFFGINVSMSK